MKRFLCLWLFLLKSQFQQWGGWFSTMLFYMISFFMLGMLLSPPYDSRTVWAFYLLLQNFGVAYFLKDAFLEDFNTTRLHALMQQSLPFESFLLATLLAQATQALLMQVVLIPLLWILFPAMVQSLWIPLLLFQILSSFYLVMIYLLGASFALKSKLGGFLNLVIGLPLLVPWFLLGFEYLIYQDKMLLEALAALILVLLPCVIYAQRWILRMVTVWLG